MFTMRHLAATGTVATALLLGGCGSPSTGHDMGDMASPTTSSTSNSAAAAAPASGPHNDADITFASMMIPHHLQAIAMSDVLLAKDGVDPKVTALAQKIKGAQGPEVAQLSGWLAGWGQNPSPSTMGGMDEMDHGDGMMSQADMHALDQATGDNAAQLFLTGMIKHHRGAVTMAETELADGQNSDTKKLAQTIATAQQAEITEMNQLLGE